ncbi:FAD-dependent oxidoreductase [Sulfurimonas sp. HSL-1716]|uniref:NAD(P)/FAD-dependent oxidoreductase n=1 Tax=Hydrocurvibacter sulfurireducens TaxID=3131937 RepID=UPI0031F9E0D0
MEKKKLFIIGAGYAGIRAVSHLSKCKDIELYLLDKNSYHYLQTDVYDYLTSQINLSDIAIDLYTYCASYNDAVTFLHEEVLRFDLEKKKIITTKNRYKYDYLIIASGAQTLLPDSIEGLKEHYHGIKSLENALLFKQKFEYFIYKKIESEGKCSLDANFNIVITGSGLSGVEIASEMANYSREFYKDTGYLCSGINITLINSHEKLLPSNSAFMQEEAEKRLNDLEINIIKNARVTKVMEDCVILNNSQKIDMNFLIWTAGITSSDLVLNMDAKKNKKGQLAVDEFFRLIDHKEVYAIGDNADMFDPASDTRLPPTAQTAELSADYVSQNILKEISDKKLQTKSIKLQGFFASLGGRFGCGEVMNILKFSGKKAYFLKKFIEKSYRYPLHQRCKKGLKKIKSLMN